MSATTCSPIGHELRSRVVLEAVDPHEFRRSFNRCPFKIQHRLVNHPLFQLDSLVHLAQQLPLELVEYNAGNLPVTQDPSSTPQNGLSVEETIRRVEECQSWMVLKNVEQVPEYKRLLDDCLDIIEQYSAPIAPGMCRREGFIFVSSAGSVTPFHIDPENNFLLQIRGSKEVQLFDAQDRQVVQEETLEAFFSGAHRNLSYDETFQDRGKWFELVPGQGLHFPVVAPHWVRNGPEVSISFSITFQTASSQDRQSLHRFNATLRRWGLRPSPVGQSAVRDALKLSVVRAGQTAKRWIQG